MAPYQFLAYNVMDHMLHRGNRERKFKMGSVNVRRNNYAAALHRPALRVNEKLKPTTVH